VAQQFNNSIMNNLWLVIQREYLTRVRRKSFILATLLMPLGMAVFVVVVQFIFSYGNDEQQRIVVVDDANIFNRTLPDSKNLYFKFRDEPLADLKKNMAEDSSYNAILVIPTVTNPRLKDFRVEYFSDDPLALDTEMAISRRVEKAMRKYKTSALELDATAIAALETDIDIKTRKITVEEGEDDDTSMAGVIGAILGSVMGFLMYISIFVYGMMVMRSVMEEKISRIVEVVISSVKPTTLLLGKIIGVGGVGLTQVLAWMILIPSVLALVALVFGFDPDTAQQMQAGSATSQLDPDEMQSMIEQAISGLDEMNWWVIIPAFLLYFLCGYFMYAAMFAAIGSAMGDDMGEGQSLTLIVMIPVILGFYIMMAALQAPNSSLAVGSSFVPLFAPIVMPARLPFDPPAWQIIGSLLVTVIFSGFMVWLAGRIYRVGILNYGKKGSLKDMGRWLFSKY
jgi:ABC-2 type transport system permease protein